MLNDEQRFGVRFFVMNATAPEVMRRIETLMNQVAAEREAAIEECAKACEAYAIEVNGQLYGTSSRACAAAIRALKGK